MSHEPQLHQSLRNLLAANRTAALGTLDETGYPFVSMVPFAVEPQNAMVVIHVSGLALHTRNLLANPQVSVLVAQAEVSGEKVHALPRVSLQGLAAAIDGSGGVWVNARNAYLRRFPEALPMTELGDFMFIGIQILSARQVAGFGAARSLDAVEMVKILRA